MQICVDKETERGQESLPLAFQFRKKLSTSAGVLSSSNPTARNSGGTTGGGPSSEDANIDYD